MPSLSPLIQLPHVMVGCPSERAFLLSRQLVERVVDLVAHIQPKYRTVIISMPSSCFQDIQSRVYLDALHKQPANLPSLPPPEDPGPDSAYAILAKELNQLSIQERDNIFADIHGVSGSIEETPDIVSKALRELQEEIDKLVHKAAYLEAAQQSPDYVQSVALRLRFLRGHRFHARDAAAAMVAFFETKLELFGSKCLGRDVTLCDDFDEADMDFLRRGIFQILPGRDNSGRVVLAHWPYIQSPIGCSVMSRMRTYYYTIMAATESESSQKAGIVCLMYTIGSTPDRQVEREAIWRAARITKSVPVRINCIHYCYDCDWQRPLINLGMVVSGEEIRARFRAHFMSHIECMYTLSTFGIHGKNFPMSTMDTSVDTTQHLKWIEKRLGMEERSRSMSSTQMDESSSSTEGSGKASVTKIIPRENDIIYGRGKSYQNHKGNVWCRAVVEANLARYEAASKRGKTEITVEILKQIRDRSGRFLKLENEQWEEVDELCAKNKISHMFRSRRQISEAEEGGNGFESFQTPFKKPKM